MEFETTSVSSKRILSEGQQHTCDKCGQPATTSCRDALELVFADFPMSSWTQSEPRYGCAMHEVKPVVRFKDGRTMTWEEYANS